MHVHTASLVRERVIGVSLVNPGQVINPITRELITLLMAGLIMTMLRQLISCIYNDHVLVAQIQPLGSQYSNKNITFPEYDITGHNTDRDRDVYVAFYSGDSCYSRTGRHPIPVDRHTKSGLC